MTQKNRTLRKLKPCPFCGGPVTTRIGMMGLRFFCCRSCGSITSFDTDYLNHHPAEAEGAWNRRDGDD